MAAEVEQSQPREEGEVDRDQPNFAEKHPLEYKWTLYFDKPDQKQNINKYGQTLRPVYTFDTVEDFWCLYNNIRTPSQLQPSATFYLFKDGIQPKWEDSRNAKGGCWTAVVPNSNKKQTLDTYWLSTVLACIGEQFTDSEEICGIAVNVRQRGDRVEVWTRTAANEAAQVTIGRQLKQYLDIPDGVRIGYSVFEEKLNEKGGKAKDKYIV